MSKLSDFSSSLYFQKENKFPLQFLVLIVFVLSVFCVSTYPFHNGEENFLSFSKVSQILSSFFSPKFDPSQSNTKKGSG